MKLIFFVTVLSVCLLQGVYGMNPTDDTVLPCTFDNFLSQLDVTIAEMLGEKLGFVIGNIVALFLQEDSNLSVDPEDERCYVGTVAKILQEVFELLGLTYIECVEDRECAFGYTCQRVLSPVEGILGFCFEKPMQTL
ncbi:hypothetical protein Anas_04835 [Armadillidium nasatum]|uniref:Uncharacterized protein n=1 Tax=Armadillidium nasatum TaxID=96803 RepID=A0A5N5TM17_9CRUS|nr:hypothetical protein Anas_04835 [Armadillidium nasatum]